jgi:hypothetical protein
MATLFNKSGHPSPSSKPGHFLFNLAHALRWPAERGMSPLEPGPKGSTWAEATRLQEITKQTNIYREHTANKQEHAFNEHILNQNHIRNKQHHEGN